MSSANQNIVDRLYYACHIVLILVLFFIFSNFSRAQILEKGYLPTINYPASEYVGGMQQNWAIVQDQRGVMYFGNNGGVLEFDGVSWRLIESPGGTNIRSMVIDNEGMIYVGAQGDFGFLMPDTNGTMDYVSLLKHIKKEDRTFSDVWTTLVTDDGVYFQSKEKIFRWKDNSIKAWSISGPISNGYFHKMFFVNGTIYVRYHEKGLMKLIDDRLVLIQGGELFADEEIHFMLPFDNDIVLLNAQSKGLLLMNPTDPDYFPVNRFKPEQINMFFPFPTQIDKFLVENKVLNAIALGNNLFSIATDGGGVAIIDGRGNLIKILNKNTGLQDATVNYQFVDRQDNLWLALANGLTKVEINSPITYFDDRTGLNGAIEFIVRHNGRLYVAGGLGVFYLDNKIGLSPKAELDLSDYEFSKFKKVNEIKVQCWNLISVSGEGSYSLLVASNSGIIEIDNNNDTSMVAAYDTWMFHRHKQYPNWVFCATASGVALLNWDNGKWTDLGIIAGLEKETMRISENDDGDLWLGFPSDGIWKVSLPIEWDGNISASFEVTKFDTLSGIPNDASVAPYQVNGKTVFVTFSTIGGVYQFNDNQFVTTQPFGPRFEYSNYIHRVKDDQGGNVWIESVVVVDEDNVKFELGYATLISADSIQWVSKPFNALSDAVVHAIYHDDNDITWLGGPKGIFSYDNNNNKNYVQEYAALIRQVTLGEDSVIFGGAFYNDDKRVTMDQASHLVFELPYAYNSITFNYAAPSFEDEKGVLFSYYLEGFDKGWSSWSQDAKKYYTNLSEGDYRFRVKATNVYENESTEAVYAFTILPPWQRTVLAYIGLFLGFIGFVWMAIRVSTKGLQNIIKEKTAEVVMQKEEIEMKNQDITDSINYAQKIQQALLPAEETIKKSLPNSFILFKPKDIVSGDFYWYTEKDNKALIAAADCTGHGVPGAFMSMIGTALLNEIVNDTGVTRPADILQALKEGVIKALKQTGDAGTQKDGMDISLCSFDFDKGVVEYAGAYNSLFLIRDNQLEETKADRMPIGIYSDDHGKKFTNHEIKMEKGDVFYLFSDGYLDQFGGPKGKKFMGKRFKGLLMDIFSKSMNEQKAVMDDTIEDWKDHIEDGSVFEQMDDILVIGIKV